jgi:hypothetical protein
VKRSIHCDFASSRYRTRTDCVDRRQSHDDCHRRGEVPSILSQPGAHIVVLESVSALVAYAVAVVWIGRTRGAKWDAILRCATLFGLLSGTLEALNIGIENGIPIAIHNPALPIGFMLTIFTSWRGGWISNYTLSELNPCRSARRGFNRWHLYACCGCNRFRDSVFSCSTRTGICRNLGGVQEERMD